VSGNDISLAFSPTDGCAKPATHINKTTSTETAFFIEKSFFKTDRFQKPVSFYLLNSYMIYSFTSHAFVMATTFHHTGCKTFHGCVLSILFIIFW